MVNPAIFKVTDISGKAGSELTETVSRDVGRALADWLKQPGAVAVGRDIHPDSAALATAVIEGLRMQGREVYDIGLVTNDMLAFTVGKYVLAGGVMVNGVKDTGEHHLTLYGAQAAQIGVASGLNDIQEVVTHDSYKEMATNPGPVSQRDVTDEWATHCLSFIRGLQPFHIAIDAGHGAIGGVLPHVLSRLAVSATQMHDFQPDGAAVHEANPQKPETLAVLIQAVKDYALDFGVAFGSNGVRAVFVDDRGRLLVGSDLLSIAARLYLQKYPKSQIVHDVRVSRASQELIRQWGGAPVRAKADRASISAKLREVGAPLGGGATGHLFFKENYYGDSGLITALVVMQALSDSHRRLSELVDEYHLYAISLEEAIEVGDPQTALFSLAKAFSDGTQDTLDGLTVNYPDMWFNMSASSTEPVIRLNAEARTQGQLDALVQKIKQVITE